MKIGDLVTVKPAKTGVYLIAGEDPNKENNWPNSSGVVLGKLYKLYAPELDENLVDMHEKYIEIINER